MSVAVAFALYGAALGGVGYLIGHTAAERKAAATLDDCVALAVEATLAFYDSDTGGASASWDKPIPYWPSATQVQDAIDAVRPELADATSWSKEARDRLLAALNKPKCEGCDRAAATMLVHFPTGNAFEVCDLCAALVDTDGGAWVEAL